MTSYPELIEALRASAAMGNRWAADQLARWDAVKHDTDLRVAFLNELSELIEAYLAAAIQQAHADHGIQAGGELVSALVCPVCGETEATMGRSETVVGPNLTDSLLVRIAITSKCGHKWSFIVRQNDTLVVLEAEEEGPDVFGPAGQ